MTTATNVPVWSRSRAAAFDECRRKFVLTVLSEAELKKITIENRPSPSALKSLKNRHLWFGAVLHEGIGNLLIRLRQGEPLPEKERFIEEIRRRMRNDYQTSLTDPQSPSRLFEHHYRHAVAPEDWKSKWIEAERSIRWFFDSSWLARLKTLGPENWKVINEVAGFDVDGVKVYCKVDCALEIEGKFVLIDWVTGALKPIPSDSLVLAALYAHQVWEAEPDRIEAYEISLRERRFRRVPVEVEQLLEKVNRIHEETERMSRFDWPPENDPLKADGPLRLSACRRCSYQGFCHPGGLDGPI